MQDLEEGWAQDFLVSADRHHDNLHCNQELEAKHLAKAKEVGAGVLDFGDLFCAMQGKWDKRSDETQMRPELRGNNYIDNLVETAADFYAPYAHQFLLMGQGNHETQVLKRHQTNLTERLVKELNTRTGSKIAVGGFSGWVVFYFKLAGKEDPTPIRLWFHHGYGGDAPVTKGTIQTARQAVYTPDADVIVTGHTHNDWIFPIPRQRIGPKCQLYKDEQLHIKVPGYKEEYGDGYENWMIERGGPPKNLGACWLQFKVDGGKIVFDAVRAK